MFDINEQLEWIVPKKFLRLTCNSLKLAVLFGIVVKNPSLYNGVENRFNYYNLFLRRNQFCWKLAFFDVANKQKVIFLWQKSLLLFKSSTKNFKFCQNWVFGPFLAFWLSDIFLTWIENKKWFFSQKNHFSFVLHY